MEPNEYIDNRGVWPTYVRGCVGVSLEGKPHTISLDDARAYASHLQKMAVTLR